MISYVLADCHLSGGAKVVFEHVAGLRERGIEAQVLYRSGSPGWFGREVPCHRYLRPREIARHPGIKVATWCGTAAAVRDAGGGYYLVQDLDEETYMGREPETYSYGLHHITEGRWVESQLAERFGATSSYIGIGTRFEPVKIERDMNRVFTQCRTGQNNLKGWPTTVAVMRGVFARRPVSVVSFGIEPGRVIHPRLPQIHVRFPTDYKLRELYSQAGVFLFTPRHEGFGLPALEAMACGTPVVCTAAQGNEEFCIHGETALVGHSEEELVEHVQHVMGDRALWDRLSAAGMEMANRYRWPGVIDKLMGVFK